MNITGNPRLTDNFTRGTNLDDIIQLGEEGHQSRQDKRLLEYEHNRQLHYLTFNIFSLFFTISGFWSEPF